MSDIKTFKLVSGDEVVASVEGESPEGIIVSKPRTFQVIQDPSTGQISAGLVPWFLSDPDASCSLALNAIISSIDTTKDLQNSYIEQTTGLKVASSSGIIA